MILADHESKIAHLLRRTGFVATKNQVDELRSYTLPEIVDRLLNAPQPAPKLPTYEIADKDSLKDAIKAARNELDSCTCC